MFQYIPCRLKLQFIAFKSISNRILSLVVILASDLSSEFDTQSQNNLGFPYDKKSIMQYGKTAFGKTLSDGTTAVTMQSKSNPDEKLGAPSHMDAMDLEKINLLYKCDHKKCKLYWLHWDECTTFFPQ